MKRFFFRLTLIIPAILMLAACEKEAPRFFEAGGGG